MFKEVLNKKQKKRKKSEGKPSFFYYNINIIGK